MNAEQQLFVADMRVKAAGSLDTATAGAAGLLGPLGTYLYGKARIPDEMQRYELIGRSALGSSVGALTGSLAGIPISMATGIPLLPGMALSGLLGAAGGSAGAVYARQRQKRRDSSKKKKQDHESDKT